MLNFICFISKQSAFCQDLTPGFYVIIHVSISLRPYLKAKCILSRPNTGFLCHYTCVYKFETQTFKDVFGSFLFSMDYFFIFTCTCTFIAGNLMLISTS